MAVKKTTTEEKPKYGIRVKHDDGLIGWIAGENGDIRRFETLNEARKWLEESKSSGKYSWNCEAAAMEFTGFTPTPVKEPLIAKTIINDEDPSLKPQEAPEAVPEQKPTNVSSENQTRQEAPSEPPKRGRKKKGETPA